jgi:hypothetical protein
VKERVRNGVKKKKIEAFLLERNGTATGGQVRGGGQGIAFGRVETSREAPREVRGRREKLRKGWIGTQKFPNGALGGGEG